MCRLLQISCPFCRMGPIDATPRAIYVTRHSCNTCRISDAYLQHRGLVFAFLLPCLAAGGPALRERESAWKSEKDQSATSSFFTCADPFPHSKNHTQVHKLLNSSTLNLCESDSETESMHTHTHMYTRVLKHTHMHTHTRTHSCTCTCTHTRTRKRKRTCTCTRTESHTTTHTSNHTQHTHTQSQTTTHAPNHTEHTHTIAHLHSLTHAHTRTNTPNIPNETHTCTYAHNKEKKNCAQIQKLTVFGGCQ